VIRLRSDLFFSFVSESLSTHQGQVKALSALPNAEGLNLLALLRCLSFEEVAKVVWIPSYLGGNNSATA